MEQSPASSETLPVLPHPRSLKVGRLNVLANVPEHGLGLEATNKHLQEHIVPALNGGSKSANYYGFVTGGATPAAAFADNVVTEYDQNAAVHLPEETIATDVENRALYMLCQLLDLDCSQWDHKTFTTGATASNVLGLACGREYVVQKAAERRGKSVHVSEDGIFEAMRQADLNRVQIVTTAPHSSLRKAASIVGLGRSSIVEACSSTERHRFDFSALEAALKAPKTASIVAVSFAEVNAGLFATSGAEMARIRQLCDQYGAWIHIDAAFGAMARLLPDTHDYSRLRQGVEGMELADSITGDAHKLLNVPYDCGFFLSRHLPTGIQVFQNPNAAYLNIAPSESTASTDRVIPSPLNIGIENSRRFRALPVYATLAAYGREGYRDMLERQIKLARRIAKFMQQSDHFEVLPPGNALENVYMVVLFRARDDSLNKGLVQRINGTRKIYVSGTQWDGKLAARFAVANWQVDVSKDIELIADVLEGVVRDQVL